MQLEGENDNLLSNLSICQVVSQINWVIPPHRVQKIWQFAKYLPALQWPCCQSKGFFVLVTIFSGDHSLEVVSHSDLVHIPACMSVVNIFVFVIVSYQLDRSRFFRCSLALLLSLSLAFFSLPSSIGPYRFDRFVFAFFFPKRCRFFGGDENSFKRKF